MPNPIVVVFFSTLAFALAASGDWLETRYVRSVRAWEDAKDPERARAARERAAWASVSMWLVGIVAWVSVIEVGWWVVLPEGLGLYCGTKWAMRR